MFGGQSYAGCFLALKQSIIYQVYMASLVGQKYKVLARYGNNVQEVRASSVAYPNQQAS
jgi:hypothetical protein